MNFPNEIFLNIYSFVGPKTFYLNKDFFKFYGMLKQEFLENPIKINYKLIRWKKRIYKDHDYRPSLCIDKTFRDIDFKGNFFIGNIENQNNIKWSKNFEDLIIPSSQFQYSTSLHYKGFVVYWTVYQVKLNDSLERFKCYNNLWNNF